MRENRTIPCRQCGKAIPVRCERDLLRKRFCSRQCAGRYTGLQKTSGKIATICRTCGVTIIGFPSRKRAYCSRACYAAKPSRWLDKGYMCVPDRLYGRHRRREHIVIAERALGRRLKPGEVVHHWNMDKTDNRHCNLLICDNDYHMWLHQEYARRFARLWFEPKPQAGV